jgi:UMF1 family MFS transporter
MELNKEMSTVKPPRTGWQLYFSLPILSWALYDFASTIFSSNIVTIFFPFYLTETIGGSEQLDQIASTFIGYANALSSLFLVLFSPLYGVWIDRTGQKKSFLIPFMIISVTSTIGMGLFALTSFEQTMLGLPLSIALVLVLFVLAKFCFNSSLIFYDSMISDLGTKPEIPLISGFGVAVGYVGTLVGLTIYPLVADNGYHLAFILTGAMFLLFSLPILLFFKDQSVKKQTEKKSFISGYKEIYATFKEAKYYKGIFLFMIAYFFFNDAIATAIAMMAVYAKAIAGFTTGKFIILYLVSTVFAICSSFVFGYITKKVGAKNAVGIVAGLLFIALCFDTFAINQTMFWVAGALYGVAMGAMWVTSRTMIVELTPYEKRGQFFGLFAFSGKISSIVGPTLYGTITLILANYGNIASRTALGSLLILVLIGFIIHLKVPYEKSS